MKTQTELHAPKTQPSNPFINAAVIATVALAIMPAAILGAVRVFHSNADAPAKAAEAEEAASKRSSAAERRAQRLEAHKAKEAKTQNNYPEISMETVEPYYDDFGMDFDADMEFDEFGMMPPAYMGGPGMMPAPNRGGFNGGGRMPGAGRDFDNGFGRGRGGF